MSSDDAQNLIAHVELLIEGDLYDRRELFVIRSMLAESWRLPISDPRKGMLLAEAKRLLRQLTENGSSQ